MHEIVSREFVHARAPMPLGEDEIHVWFFAAPAAHDVRTGLSLHLRELLGAYLRADAASLCIERDMHGKPFLGAPHEGAMQFNLAHSADALIVALARTQPLGIDIETTRRKRPWIELARRYFTIGEGMALAALPADRLGAAFVQLWSCKEAVLKSLGRGIAFGLERLDFAIDAQGTVTGLRAIAAEAGPVEEWQLRQLAPAPGLCGTLAWRGPAMRVCSFRAEFEYPQ